MGETKRTLNIRAEEYITAIKSASKRSHTENFTAGNTIMTLTGKIRKYWNHQRGNLLRRKRASYQWNTPQITKYLETNTTRKQSKENNRQNYNVIKLSPQRSATEVHQSETTLKYFDPLRTYKYHTHTHITCPNPSHHQTDKLQFADDAGQWAVSKNIDLAAEYLQRDLDKLARWCAKWRIKLNPEKRKVIIFSKSRFAIRAEPALSLYGDLLSYYPQIKFLGITFDNRMTFTKHFEEILERCNQKFHCLRILVNKKWGPSPETILQIYTQCVRPIFEYGIVSTITVSETVITKIQRVQNSFIRLALRLPKYVSTRLLHEASGLPYVKERLISVGQNHIARMHANPLDEHTINSAKTNIAWDKYKTPLSIVKPPD